jgi:CRP-like cAMP-binding protein
MLGMMRMDCHRRRHYMHTIELIAMQSLPVKVARYLLRLARDYGSEKDGQVHIDARLSQIDMARQMACSREGVNKQLAFLSGKGLVQLDGDIIVLVDPEGLRKLVTPLTG